MVGTPQFALDPEARAIEEFPKADRDKNGAISFDEVKVLMKRLNAHVPKKRLRHLFDEMDINKDGELSLDEFKMLFVKADERSMMQKLYKEADQLVNGHVSASNLHDFFKTTAPDDAQSGWKVPSIEECGTMISKYTKVGKKSEAKTVMQWEHFRRLLSDPETNNICDPDKVFKVYQDMKQPLSHYFISSSHNSYLEGTQTHGISTASAIRRALELGVRVIELDVWDGTVEPIVNHGHTLCKPTSFRSCIEAVNEYAFKVSEYPVILTIENHCTKSYQEKMARILDNILRDKLYRFQSSDVEKEALYRGPEQWVSPEDLIGKVVIRDKPKKMKAKKAEEIAKFRRENGEATEDGSGKISLELNPETKDSKAVASKKKRQSRKDVDAVSVDLASSNREMMDSTPIPLGAKKKNQGLMASLFRKKHDNKSSRLNLMGTSSSLESKGGPRSLGAGNDSDKTLNEMGKGERRESNRSQNNYDEEDDDEDDVFIDDKVENEGLGDQMAAKIQDKKQQFQLSMTGSIRFAVNTANKLGLLTEDDIAPKMREWLTVPPTPKDLPTNSVAQLLEIVYIKNVKLRMREDKAKRPSVKNGEFSIIKDSDFKLIHYVYPEWRSSSSIPESKMVRLVKPGPRAAALSTYAKYHILRCYPSGGRVESTNYDPCPAWNAGIQIVALNYQTNGKSVWVNQGMFSDNGACGWVLKPKAMLEARSCGRDTPDEESPEEESKRYWDLLLKPEQNRADRFVITIVSAHFLPKPLGEDEVRSEIIDPFVEVHVCGFSQDEAMWKTKVIDDNGFNPEFNETTSFTIRKYELDMLLFIVKDKDTFGEQFIGQNCFPLKLVRPGYRIVPLRRPDSSPIPDAFLFVHIRWERGAVPLS